LILGVGFEVQLSTGDIAKIHGPGNVPMATSFLTKIAITGSA